MTNKQEYSFFQDKKVIVTGGAGFIGSHLVKKLVLLGSKVTILDNFSRGSQDTLKEILSNIKLINTDLRDENKSQKYFDNQEIVFNLAALNTGVDYDLGRTEVMFEDNMLLQMMPLRMAKKSNSVKKFIQVSSASVYSSNAMDNQVPTPEDADISNPEPSKLGYALAKKMGENLASWYNENTSLDTYSVRFINVYGENDNFDDKGHFIPVMVRKFIEAKKKVNIFGSGNQKRSFMHVEDAVSALLTVAEKGVPGEVYNVDSNNEKSIKEVVNLINDYFSSKELILNFDRSKPEGSKRRMLDSSKLKKLGWIPKVGFEDGLNKTVKDIEGRI
ncbi:MAG: NAD-dependent epimerase/dehydratase family protein [Candidatus Pacebacteria bacterium]|jgi:nucleoside-diphosphate-sugar epimerase|nr:NAD-dependent epimerase/dehydratase family protein [Candidatus Paceibacterota bacterium]MBT6756369.1 NAD-dependent epimerase/dehydratase family protein [Candidatus Paceibacterota bacterium]MBT6921660.1 NAD-dependent epimerase/dehydratase family protein [Candidatus Paceibacterota bacterium]